jgi:carbamoyltransferase
MTHSSTNKILWGISALNHDASITVMQDDEILFAAHSERYSRIKNDSELNPEIINAALEFGVPDEIIWHEHPILKKSRQLLSGQYDEVKSELPSTHLIKLGLWAPNKYMGHHQSHAAAGYFTSGFDDAVIIVADGIGEWDTLSLWKGTGNQLKKISSVKYPDSLGLFYSAITQRVGLKPNEEEYILMGMAAYGDPTKLVGRMKHDLIFDMTAPKFKLKENMHRGIKHWMADEEVDLNDIAAAAQAIVEEYMINLAKYTSKYSKNLVLMGGVALNCVANTKIVEQHIVDDVWIMPNPGDAGSSLGAVLAYTKRQAKWRTPYLGTNIDREFDADGAINTLLENGMIAVANGRAEFGPRAFGNRSLIADPRGDKIKDMVNDIKKRQRFRPFAPIILEHLAEHYFDMPVPTSPYMQMTVQCKFPDKFPAICHVDGSSRVQTINREQNPVLYDFLTKFYEKTGCPILLNTSLNIKGEPLVDTWEDAIRFSEKYNVKLF